MGYVSDVAGFFSGRAVKQEVRRTWTPPYFEEVCLGIRRVCHRSWCSAHEPPTLARHHLHALRADLGADLGHCRRAFVLL